VKFFDGWATEKFDGSANAHPQAHQENSWGLGKIINVGP